jgi:hypothetical protein
LRAILEVAELMTDAALLADHPDLILIPLDALPVISMLSTGFPALEGI